MHDQGFVEAHPWHFHGAKVCFASGSIVALAADTTIPQYWDMGAGTGNFSYEALEEIQGSVAGSPIPRDTSIVYGGPGASYTGANITSGSPGGWRLFRLSITDVSGRREHEISNLY